MTHQSFPDRHDADNNSLSSSEKLIIICATIFLVGLGLTLGLVVAGIG